MSVTEYQIETDTEVAIIGAGPIGLELAANLKHAGVDYQHFDAAEIGHTMTWYPRRTPFFSSPDRIAIAGVPLNTTDQRKATGEQYLAYLRGVVEQFDLPIHTFHRVEAIRPISSDSDSGSDSTSNTGFQLDIVSQRGRTVCNARKVVVAIGDMHHPRRLDIPGENLPHVSHYFDDPHRYFRKKLVIVGGRNSAVEAAIRCQRIGADVTLSYRGDTFDAASVKYWILPEIRWLIDQGRIHWLPHTQPTRITQSDVQFTTSPVDAKLASADDPTTTIAADFVLLLTGYVMDATLLSAAGVTLAGENQAPAFNFDTMETNVPGLFVAGTAAAGTQHRFKLFIENCHPHVVKITRALTGGDPLHINPLGFTRLDEREWKPDLQPES